MHSGLIFHDSIDTLIVGRKLEDNLLVATSCTRGLIIDLQLPAAFLGVLRVHSEKVTGEDGGLVTTSAATDLDDGVLAVIRIGRDEENLDLLLHLRDLRLDLGDLSLRHVAKVLVLLVDHDVLGLCQLIDHLLVLKTGLDDRLQLLIVLVELDVFLHISDHLRISKLLLKRLVFVLESQDLVH